MDGQAPVEPWRPNLPPSRFPCPLCAGSAVVTSHPETVGIVRLRCERGCAEADLEAKCRAKVPMAFVYRDDLIPEIPEAAIAAIVNRLDSGVANADSFAALGGPGAKKILGAVDKLRARSDTISVASLTNQRGGVVALELRGDHPDSESKAKSFLPVHMARTAHGTLEARLGLFERSWPLVGRHTLAAADARSVLIVEGEKARKVAAELLEDYVCITSLCGAENAHCSDWSPVTGRKLVILRDNDEAGMDYA